MQEDSPFSSQVPEQIGPEQPPVLVANHSKKRLISVVLALALIVGVGATYFFTKSDKMISKTPASSTAVSKAKGAAAVSEADAYYFLESQYDKNSPSEATHRLVAIDPVKGNKTTIFSQKDTTENTTNIIGFLRVGSISRTFMQSTSTDASKKTTVSLKYQDNDKAPKTIYSVSYQDNATAGATQLFTGFGHLSTDSKGNSFDFYESGPTARYIKRVNIDGTVQELAKTIDNSSASPWGVAGFGNIVPEYQSPDGKTVYLRSYSCLNCDGPPHADIVALDVATKTFSMPFKDPTLNTYGDWQVLNPATFWVTAASGSNLGPMSYESAISAQSYLYSYNVVNKSFKKVFESTPSDQYAATIGSSKEGDKVYVAIWNYQKGADLLSKEDLSQGHSFTQSQKEIREYDATTGNYTVLNLPIDYTKLQVNSIHSIKDQLLIETQKVYTPTTSDYDTTLSILKRGGSQSSGVGQYGSTGTSGYFLTY